MEGFKIKTSKEGMKAFEEAMKPLKFTDKIKYTRPSNDKVKKQIMSFDEVGNYNTPNAWWNNIDNETAKLWSKVKNKNMNKIKKIKSKQ